MAFGFQHVCFIVSDMDEALKLWCDTLGFILLGEPKVIPDNKEWFDQATLDDIFKHKDSQSLFVNVMDAVGGAILELQCPINPPVQKNDAEHIGYGFTGIRELALVTDNLDQWFEKIKAAGYRVQTDYIWTVPGCRSFLFYDADGNLIQLVEVVQMG